MFQTHMFRMKSEVLDLHRETANLCPSSCSIQAESMCLAMCYISSCLDVFFRDCSSWFLLRFFLPIAFPFWGHTLISERLIKFHLSACRAENSANTMEIRFLFSPTPSFKPCIFHRMHPNYLLSFSVLSLTGSHACFSPWVCKPLKTPGLLTVIALCA